MEKENERYKTEGLTKAFNHILDVFTGADGGGEFCNLMWFLDVMDKRACNGDEAARKIIEQVLILERMIIGANKQMEISKMEASKKCEL